MFHLSWPNYSIPVSIDMATDITSTDSLNLWNYLRLAEWFFWKDNICPNNTPIVIGQDKGIIVKRQTSGVSGTQTFVSGDYLFTSSSKITPNNFNDSTMVLHQVSYHGLINASGHDTPFCPSNYLINVTSVITQAKDAIYMGSRVSIAILAPDQ